jgi:hypothetical protein
MLTALANETRGSPEAVEDPHRLTHSTRFGGGESPHDAPVRCESEGYRAGSSRARGACRLRRRTLATARHGRTDRDPGADRTQPNHSRTRGHRRPSLWPPRSLPQRRRPVPIRGARAGAVAPLQLESLVARRQSSTTYGNTESACRRFDSALRHQRSARRCKSFDARAVATARATNALVPSGAVR